MALPCKLIPIYNRIAIVMASFLYFCSLTPESLPLQPVSRQAETHDRRPDCAETTAGQLTLVYTSRN